MLRRRVCAIPEAEVVCPGSLGLGEIHGERACDLCVTASCCAEATACAGEPDCAERMQRFKTCGREDRSPGCYTQDTDPNAQNDSLSRLMACAASSCRSECSLGSELACTGAYRWPAAESEQLTVRLHIFDDNSATKAGFEDIAVKACGPLDAECLSPIDEDTTDADGVVELVVGAESPHGGELAGWSGFVLMDPPAGEDRFLPALFQRNKPEFRSTIGADNVPLQPRGLVVTGLERAAMPAALDLEDLGHAVGAIHDCHGLVKLTAASDIEIALGSESETMGTGYLYVDDVLPRAEPYTGTDGRFVVANIVPGLTTFTPRHRVTKREVARVLAPVMPGRVTILGVWPNPEP